jgi:exonuclease III
LRSYGRNLQNTYPISLELLHRRIKIPFKTFNGVIDSEQGQSFNILQWNCRSIKGKNHFLQICLQTHDVQIFALQETWLKEDEVFSIRGYNILHHDGTDGYRGVLIGIKNSIQFKKTLERGGDTCNIVGAEILIDYGQRVNIVSAYCARGLALEIHTVSDVLAGIQGPILIMGDFNTHSRSWGCEFEDSRTHRVFDMFEQLNLVQLNDGTHTRIAEPPRRSSAVDLTLCTSDLALTEYTWTVLEDAAGSDHLPILTSFASLNFPKKYPISLVYFFNSMGLTISISKSETMLFSRNHERPLLSVIIGSHTLPQVIFF